jgi:ech hydrogenase subunit C
MELKAILTPRYDVERFGGLMKGTPRHADIFLVTGIINHQNRERLEQIYAQMPEPKVVVAVGACAISKGVFYDSCNSPGPLDKIIPVDVYVPGCPPKPEAILDGILKATEKFSKK